MPEMKEEGQVTNILYKNMEEVMHESMIPYSEHVILERALPRVEDGLKPVQRRILYTMMTLGLKPELPYRKSALTVGECIAKYHPHGDRSIYDALVRLAQPFNMRCTLVDGHGNFGSVDGDGAAAMRYTESKLSPLALELLRDLDKNTVKWSKNFDDSRDEPDMLPGRFPNLLVNGSSGIAVGLATNIPSHNLGEVIDGVVAYIDNRSITLKNMMRIVKGPDFSSGAYIIAGEELEKAYETGRGKIILRAKIHIESGDNDKKLIVIDELPYQVNKAALLQSIMTLREEKKGILTGISEIIDESDRNGMRAVIKIKKDVDPNPIIEMLFKATNLQQTFGINMVAIADGKPQQMGLLDIIAFYVDYQREVVLRRSKFELDEAKAREHILLGLVIAVKNIDEVVRIIKTSANTGEARSRLRERFDLSEIQAQAILDLRLARLTSLEVYKLEEELKEVQALIEKLTAIVNSRKLQMELVKSEILQIKKSYKDPRRTVILQQTDDYKIPSDLDAKAIEECVVAVTVNACIKRMTPKNFTMSNKEFNDSVSGGDLCAHLFEASTDETLMCFTSLGNCFKIDLEDIEESKWRDKGISIRDFHQDFGANERVVFVQRVKDDLPKGNLLFYTRDGMVKKTDWTEYSIVKSSFQAIKLKEGDELIGMEYDTDKTTLLFVTKDGMCLNADKSDIPAQGRVAGGVKGIMLSEGDYVVDCSQVTNEGEAVVVTNKAYAKKVKVSQIDVMARYRKGVKIADLKGDNGDSILYSKYITDDEYFVFCDKDDYQICFCSKDISKESRTGKGKALLKLKDGDFLVKVYSFINTAKKA